MIPSCTFCYKDENRLLRGTARKAVGGPGAGGFFGYGFAPPDNAHSHHHYQMRYGPTSRRARRGARDRISFYGPRPVAVSLQFNGAVNDLGTSLSVLLKTAGLELLQKLSRAADEVE